MLKSDCRTSKSQNLAELHKKEKILNRESVSWTGIELEKKKLKFVLCKLHSCSNSCLMVSFGVQKLIGGKKSIWLLPDSNLFHKPHIFKPFALTNIKAMLLNSGTAPLWGNNLNLVHINWQRQCWTVCISYERHKKWNWFLLIYKLLLAKYTIYKYVASF